MCTNWKLEINLIIMFTGVTTLFIRYFTLTHDIHIHETRQTSHIRPFTSLTVKSSNSLLCKGPLIWNRISLTIQQKINIKRFAVSLKAIVVKGYEDLAEAYYIYNICSYMFVIISLSYSLFGITTCLLYMLIEHVLLNIIVTFYIPNQL